MKSNNKIERSMQKHFVLIHGFGHGAWCWYKLVTLLKSSGHRVTSLDLGACGVNPKKLEEIKLMSDYVQPLMDFMVSLSSSSSDDDEERVILVGHSYGGFCISLAMEMFPQKISVAVFVTAYMPNCIHPPSTLLQEFFKRASKESFMDCEFKFDKEGLGNPPTSASMGPEYMTVKLYQHCPLEDLELAKMLVRPNAFFLQDLSKQSLLTQEHYGLVRRVYFICEDDQTMEQQFQRFIIENSPPIEVRSIAGADHTVMLSKPRELYMSLLEISEKYI